MLKGGRVIDPACGRVGTFDVRIEVVVDPKIVADWPFPGWDGGDLGHTWLIKACKQERPCK